MAAKKKRSLVDNINRRKEEGTSRPKSRSTVSKDAYEEMQGGWPSAKKRSSSTKKKSGTGAKKKAGAKKKTGAGAKKKSGAKKKATARRS